MRLGGVRSEVKKVSTKSTENLKLVNLEHSCISNSRTGPSHFRTAEAFSCTGPSVHSGPISIRYQSTLVVVRAGIRAASTYTTVMIHAKTCKHTTHRTHSRDLFMVTLGWDAGCWAAACSIGNNDIPSAGHSGLGWAIPVASKKVGR